MEPSAETLGRHEGRMRVKKACTECRRRKRKCDGQSPCGMCSQYEYDCRYEEEPIPMIPRKRPFDPDNPTLTSSTSTDTIVTPPPPERGIMDPSRRRYMNRNSAVAFPHELGRDLQSANPPRLHSFAWNCGIRSEEPGSVHTSLTGYVTFAECLHYTEIYFATVALPFHLFDKMKFLHQCDEFFNGRNQDLILGALIGAVVSLGSLFAFRQGHALEAQIVKHVKDVLEDPTFSRIPSINQVNAWILRTLYLRSTTRPHVTWLASCNVMHLVEALGLHRDLDSGLVIESTEPPAKDDEGHKRTFWLAWCINTLVAYEYGRTKIHFNSVESKVAPFADNSDTGLQIRMARILPSESIGGDVMTACKSLEDAIQKLVDMGNMKGFPALTRGDLCFCFYRRLRLLKVSISKETVSHILTIGRAAVEAAVDLTQRRIPWWNVLGTPFQYFCVLLAVDSHESLLQVSWVLSKLEYIVMILDTHMATEALDTAKTLMKDSLAKKKQEASLLEMPEERGEMTDILPFMTRDFTLDWDAMMNPFYNGDLGFKEL